MPTNEEKMAAWVQARCEARKAVRGEMPQYVQIFLNGDNNVPRATGDTTPPFRVARWLTETTTDPNWDPILDPNWPHP